MGGTSSGFWCKWSPCIWFSISPAHLEAAHMGGRGDTTGIGRCAAALRMDTRCSRYTSTRRPWKPNFGRLAGGVNTKWSGLGGFGLWSYLSPSWPCIHYDPRCMRNGGEEVILTKFLVLLVRGLYISCLVNLLCEQEVRGRGGRREQDMLGAEVTIHLDLNVSSTFKQKTFYV